MIAVISVTSAIFGLLMFGHFWSVHNNPAEGQSIVFASFAVNSAIYIFAYRSMRRPLWRSGPLNHNQPLIWAVLLGLLMVAIAFLLPGLRELLGIVPLSNEEWLWVASVAVALLIAVEIGKAIDRIFLHR
jgi:Ca2+-transporting ATPase